MAIRGSGATKSRASTSFLRPFGEKKSRKFLAWISVASSAMFRNATPSGVLLDVRSRSQRFEAAMNISNSYDAHFAAVLKAACP